MAAIKYSKFTIASRYIKKQKMMKDTTASTVRVMALPVITFCAVLRTPQLKLSIYNQGS